MEYFVFVGSPLDGAKYRRLNGEAHYQEAVRYGVASSLTHGGYYTP